MKMKMRFLWGIMVSLVLLMGLFPNAHLNAYAADSTVNNATQLSSALSAAENGTVTLGSDIEISSTLNISGSKTLDLNGHGIKMTGNGSVIKVSSGVSLTMTDSNSNATHKYTINEAQSNGAGFATVDDVNGTETFTGGYITGGNSDYGGGVLIDNGTFIIDGGTIIGNRAESGSSWKGGGGVLVRNTNGVFTMNGGAIIGNTTQCGGALSVNDSSKATITGGELKYNYSWGNGGAINTNGNSSTASIIISGGSITNNWTQGNDFGKGGGVLLFNTSLTLSGNPQIIGNICGTAKDNVYYFGQQRDEIVLSDALSDGAEIGVTMRSPGVFTSSTDTDYNDADKFKSDDARYSVRKNALGQLFLTDEHEHDGVSFTAWVSASSLPLTAGNYYLTQDVTISDVWDVPNGTTKLCLNGHTITASKHVYIPTGRSLEIFDCGEGKFKANYRVGSAFWINGGSLTLNGGIVDASVSTAGMIDIAGNASFTMNGGKITGTSVGRYDASVIRFTGTNGTFTMNGGEITDTTSVAGVTYFEKTNVTINISGKAKIYNNKIEGDEIRNMYLPSGVKLNVTDSLDESASIGITMQTPGVFTKSSDITFNDGSAFVSDNAEYTVGKNAEGQLLLGGFIASVTKDDMTADYTELSAAVSAWTAGSTLKLLKDVEISNTISVPTGEHTLDLNGHGIKKTGSGSVINVSAGSTLNLNDTGEGEHKYTIQDGNSNGAGAGLAVIDEVSGTQTFSGGYITGGNTSSNGGGINVNGGILNMNGGTIIGNQARNGGGICITGNNPIGQVTMNGGAIIGNKAGSDGGAGVGINSGGRSESTWNTFVMNKGEIRYNYTANCVVGGGIRIYADAKCTVNGGAVTNNYSKSYGAGIGEGWLYLSGKPEIKDNYVSGNKQGNINLYPNYMIVVTGELTNETKLGVTVAQQSEGGVFTKSPDTSLNDMSKFESNTDGFIVGKNAADQLILGRAVTVTIKDAVDNPVLTLAKGSKVEKRDDPVRAGYIFKGWYSDEACTQTWDFDTKTISGDTTIYAMWEIIPATKPTISTQPKDLDLVYGYEDESISITASEAEGHTYTYEWYESDNDSTEGGTQVAGATTSTCPIPAAMDAGTTKYYYCKITATRDDNGQTAQVTSKAAKVTVVKADWTKTEIYDSAEAGTAKNIDLTAYIAPDGAMGQFSVVPETGHGQKDGFPSVSANSVNYSFKEDINNDSSAQIKIPVTGAKNYNDYEIIAEVYAAAKKRQELTFVSAKESKTYGDAPFTVSANHVGEAGYEGELGTVTYTSSAPDVATVDETTGEVTIHRAGTAVIKATASKTNYVSNEKPGYLPATAEYNLTVKKKTVALKAADQVINVGSEVPGLKNPVQGMHYSVDGLLEGDTLTGVPKLTVMQGGEEVNATEASIGFYDIVPSNVEVDNQKYSLVYECGKLEIKKKPDQTISAGNVNVKYGETGKKVSASVSEPATGGGAISYAAKKGSENYISVVSDSGVLTIKKVPADGKAYVIVTAAETATHAQTEAEVTVNISKADSAPAAVKANNRSYDGTKKPLVTVDASKQAGGTMQYALGKDAKTAPASGYTAAVPTATNAGTYYVWYKVAGDANHNDSAAKCVAVTIKEAAKTEPVKEEIQKENIDIVLKMTSKGVIVDWTRVSSADGYEVYVQYCGKKVTKPVKTIKKNSITKLTLTKLGGKAIDQKNKTKSYVVAYKMVDGKKVVVARSIEAHAVGKDDSTYTNVKSLKLAKKKITVKVGKTAKIKAKVKLADKSKKHMTKGHAAKFRYKSSDKSVATVNRNGKIKGVGKGTCEIYVYAINGMMKKVKVTVK